MDGLPAATVLEAIEDVTYAVDTEGTIVYVNAGPWDAFARENGAPALSHDHVVGRRLEEFLSGKATVGASRATLASLATGAQRRHTYRYRCDAPGMEREMRMTVSRLDGPGGFAGVLFHSVLLRQAPRPSMELLMRPHFDPALPLVTVCSYCKRFQYPPGGDAWLEAQAYLDAGGQAPVRLSHGICPRCMETIVTPMLDARDRP